MSNSVSPPVSTSTANSSAAITDPAVARIFAGQLISQICDKLMAIGLIWVISHEFSERWIPWYIAIGTLPHLLLTPWSGRLVSHWGPLRSVIGTDIFRAALFLGAAIPISKLSGDGLLAVLLVVCFVSSLAGAIFNPAIMTLPIRLATGEKLLKTNALIDSCFSIANVLGPLCAILLYQSVGLAGMFAANGFSYLVSGLLAWGVPLLPEVPSAPRTSTGALPGAIRSKLIRLMLLSFLFLNLVLAPLLVFMPWYVKHRFGGEISQLAILEAALGIGTVAGSLILSFTSLPGLGRSMRSTTVTLTAISVFYLIFSLSSGLTTASITLALLGFFLALTNVRLLNFFQTEPDQSEVPTVMSRVNLIGIATLPVSMGVLGVFMETISVPPFATACALISIAVSLATIRFPFESARTAQAGP